MGGFGTWNGTKYEDNERLTNLGKEGFKLEVERQLKKTKLYSMEHYVSHLKQHEQEFIEPYETTRVHVNKTCRVDDEVSFAR